MTLEPRQLVVPRVGAPSVQSPYRPASGTYVEDARRVLASPETVAGSGQPSFELAGPRRELFADPTQMTCGIVTCGGLCPGLNNVIRGLVLALTYGYGVRRILGFRYGYAGLASASRLEPRVLTPEGVEGIHRQGGTLLGSSRGPQEPSAMAEALLRREVGALFVVGGDGTFRGAMALTAELRRRGLEIPVIGVPKTIDNDLHWVERSFGFSSAVEEAQRALDAAHAEARGAENGVGLVKLMGRHSGSLAAHATLASGDVNLCLVPEVPFTLGGAQGLLSWLERRLARRSHAVIAVAEGAGQDLAPPSGPAGTDASGNSRLQDVGCFLRDQIVTHFARRGLKLNLKYIDPSYLLRAGPASSSVDGEFCLQLAQHAVHAAMAGRTEMMIGFWSGRFTHVPLSVAVGEPRRLDPQDDLWRSVLEMTGQPQ